MQGISRAGFQGKASISCFVSQLPPGSKKAIKSFPFTAAKSQYIQTPCGVQSTLQGVMWFIPLPRR
ncbi:MAG: hypothetical protein DBX52_00445 [Clostridiales bacterium]|nr:MAG: hypothetical protein DBX52_00445 [Clostridiales bacterium]